MKEQDRTAVCNRTEHKEENVRVRNVKTGEIGFTFGCTEEGGTIQVRLTNGQLDSWVAADCEEAPE
ncbi:hypothetical protein KIP69_00470 [Geobacter sulfurreducens]|jgi:hypothetical protein|uniref:Uncharacterized protein n=1 Tax=Geobacter sulfurreducens (strain ATCC 51573 / DSM 12127 / PCA) TaxID=243231 RepID=Q74H16_GEOSL|nr:hypothetical protein [Geobacter sulfurreducens]AAR33412.2 hypothetical protein GSU0077 [Geobacter sulfurreducens PCA]ADI82915.1 hypothetical protein KN400_0052 [Geobacter sulfurreducens KN400]AJY69808.1 hypothetical protein RW64_09515 [Geobacter sulfurreducens]QVW35358.1 hypothetical protein KIP69_00470 [Geobacter sulfurreducens]UAC04182.1 hypothetical protein KVP06_00400 [Geobacter sulfurreducens]